MKRINQIVIALPAALFACVAFADGSGPDYSVITSAVNASTVVTGIAALAGVMMLPRVARWGFRQVMGMMK
ncbi:hypothetical protein AAFM71_01105 [Chromobacterium violaceum]|uniref:hypothetical protein n=1 Tax=Chromobacterium violaceum TaxID=536 RepID=UPI003858E48A